MGEIFKRLCEIRDSADGMSKGTVMGNGPHFWSWIRDGEFCGDGRLKMTSEEASREINELIQQGKVLISVRKDELLLELPPKGSPIVHVLTTEQLRKVTDAIGDGEDFPKMTDDPLINFAVDCVVMDDEEPEYDGSYIVEATEFRKRQANQRQ